MKFVSPDIYYSSFGVSEVQSFIALLDRRDRLAFNFTIPFQTASYIVEVYFISLFVFMAM